jgi:Zinc finger, ZZ type
MDEVHDCICCNGCDEGPIVGPRYRCVDCIDDYSLCQTCLDSKGHDLPNHRMFQISPPWDIEKVLQSMTREELAYIEDDMLVGAELRVLEIQVQLEKAKETMCEQLQKEKLKASAVVDYLRDRAQFLKNKI